jgi:ribosome-binding protein aMBF1 (putative translation factor)
MDEVHKRKLMAEAARYEAHAAEFLYRAEKIRQEIKRASEIAKPPRRAKVSTYVGDIVQSIQRAREQDKLSDIEIADVLEGKRAQPDAAVIPTGFSHS